MTEVERRGPGQHHSFSGIVYDTYRQMSTDSSQASDLCKSL